MSNTGKWSISTNEENYSGLFNTAQEAIDEGSSYGGIFWVGQVRAPAPPEELFSAYCLDTWLRIFEDHEDYTGDWVDAFTNLDFGTQEELAEGIKPVIASWLDRHKLRPKHFCIDPTSVHKIDPGDCED